MTYLPNEPGIEELLRGMPTKVPEIVKVDGLLTSGSKTLSSSDISNL